MLVKPDDSADEVSLELAMIEAALIRRGTGVVSSAVTGRVVVQPGEAHTPEAGEAASARQRLSVVERALVLAKESNADCVLQVHTIGAPDDARYFVLSDAEDRVVFLETDRTTWGQTPERKRLRLQAPRLTVRAKVIDVETGSVLAAIDLTQHAADADARTFTVATKRGEIEGSTDLSFDPPDGWAAAAIDQLAAEVQGAAVAPAGSDASAPTN